MESESSLVKPPVYLSRESWLELFEKHKSSGMTLKSFCEQEGVSKSAFNSNRKKLLSSGFLEVPINRTREGIFNLQAKLLSWQLTIELKRF